MPQEAQEASVCCTQQIGKGTGSRVVDRTGSRNQRSKSGKKWIGGSRQQNRRLGREQKLQQQIEQGKETGEAHRESAGLICDMPAKKVAPDCTRELAFTREDIYLCGF